MGLRKYPWYSQCAVRRHRARIGSKIVSYLERIAHWVKHFGLQNWKHSSNWKVCEIENKKRLLLLARSVYYNCGWNVAQRWFFEVAWPLRPCNVCLFFTWRRATMNIEGFVMVVCCLKSQWFITGRTVLIEIGPICRRISGAPLESWLNFNPSMDKYLHPS